MNPVRIELATPADDPELCRILRETPMPGAIRIAVDCGPSFLAALAVQGRYNEVVVARDLQMRRVVGLACRSVKTALINGHPAPLGYLSSLRLDRAYRGGTILARMYRFVRGLHADGRTRLYLTSIIEDNTIARTILASGRCGLPAYHDHGRLCTMALSLRQAPRVRAPAHLHVRAATDRDLPAIIAFLHQEGRRRQFFPEYETHDFGAAGLLPGLAAGDVLLGFCGGQLVGTVAAWDQGALRRGRVAGYSPVVSLLRHAYNVFARLAGYPLLPRPGSQPAHFFLSLVCIRDDDPRVFGALLAQIMHRYRARYAFFVAGLHERDPLLATFRSYRCLTHSSRLYVVCWDDGPPYVRQLDGRVPYAEIGAL